MDQHHINGIPPVGVHTVTWYSSPIHQHTLCCKDGLPHRDDGKPAYIAQVLGSPSSNDSLIFSHDDDPPVLLYVYYHNGVIHNSNGPAVIFYREHRKTGSSANRPNTVIHCSNGPALLRHHANHILVNEQWEIDRLYDNNIRPPKYSFTDSIHIWSVFFLYGVEITAEIIEWSKTTSISDLRAMTPYEVALFKMTWVKDYG